MTDTPSLADRMDAACVCRQMGADYCDEGESESCRCACNPDCEHETHLCHWPGHALADEVRELQRIYERGYAADADICQQQRERIAALERENEGLRLQQTAIMDAVRVHGAYRP